MSQHITGNVGQTVETEYGSFIIIGDFRVRKSLVQAYAHATQKDADNIEHIGLGITFSNGRYFIDMNNREAAEKEIARLDWLFKKDYGHDGQS